MEKILILGINSFSGSTFARFIQDKNYKVFGLYHKRKNKKYTLYSDKKIKLKKIDNLETNKLIKYFEKIKPDIVIDFASICMVNESWKYKNYYNKVNFLSKVNFVKYLCNKNYLKKYIYISTPEVFGSRKNIYENSNKYNPSTPYASSKLKAEKLFLNFYRKEKFPIIICRFSNFYGPGQPIYRLIPKVCIMLDLGKKFPLHGSGDSERNFIYSNDFCNGIYSAIKKGGIGSTYHFSGKETVSIRQIVSKICKKKGKKFSSFVKISADRIKKDKIYSLSTKMTQKKLNWKCKVNLDSGLNNTIKFYKKNFRHLKYENIEYNLKI